MKNSVKPKKQTKTHLGSYLKRLIERAVNNPLFENNIKGSYSISPQHGVNVFKYNLTKNKEFLANFEIQNRRIFGDYRKANPREQREIFQTLIKLYPDFQIVFKEYSAN